MDAMQSNSKKFYDFNQMVDRRTTNSLKWVHAHTTLTSEQRSSDPLPMWIADMDFPVADPILKALKHELDVGALGYGGIPQTYLQAVCEWQKNRFD